MCVTIDTSQLQTAPGWISTDDGLFRKAALRPIPQYWQDPLSTFNFGEGRIENALYVANGGGDAEAAGDVFVVLLFMVAGTVEVRLLRGAPAVSDGTFSFYRLPKEHHKHLKSTNVLERLNQELKRRTHVIRIFPNEASSLRLLRALAVEIHEDWLETPRYLNMEALREQRKTEVGGFLAAA